MNYLSDLHAGRAGEYIAAADILASGYDCILADQGMPYDLIVDVDGRLLRVQVKTTRKPESATGRNVNSMLYRFWVGRCGKNGKSRYTENDIDLFALVALDTKEVGYITAAKMPTTFFVRPTALHGTHTDEIVAARNAKILSALNAGSAISALSAEFGISEGYVNRVRLGRASSHIFGTYMADLPLSVALQNFATNDNTRIGSKAANASKRAAS